MNARNGLPYTVGDKYLRGRVTLEIVEVTATHVTYTATGGAVDSKHTYDMAEFAKRESKCFESGCVFQPSQITSDEIEATCSPSAKRIQQLETELAAEREKVAKLRDALEMAITQFSSNAISKSLAETAPKEEAK